METRIGGQIMLRIAAILLLAILVPGRPALAEPITLNFDDPEGEFNRGAINEPYPGFFTWSLGWGGGILSTDSTDIGLIFLTRGGTAPFNDPDWIGARFDFIGMKVRAWPHPGVPETTGHFVARGYRDGAIVGSVAVEVGTTFTWFDFALQDIDILEFADQQYVIDLETKGGGAPFQSVSFSFDDFTYAVPEPSVGLLAILTAALGRALARLRGQPNEGRLRLPRHAARAPGLGEHRGAVLADLGFEPDAIDALRARRDRLSGRG
jgi:hypothetical protein